MLKFFSAMMVLGGAVTLLSGDVSGRNVIAWAREAREKPLFKTAVSDHTTTLIMTAANVNPSRGIQFGVRSAQPLAPGDYRLIFTVKSNVSFKERFNVILHRDPWSVVAGKMVSVRAGAPEKVVIPFTVTPELAGSHFRLPGCSFFQPFKAGAEISICNVQLLGKDEKEKPEAGQASASPPEGDVLSCERGRVWSSAKVPFFTTRKERDEFTITLTAPQEKSFIFIENSPRLGAGDYTLFFDVVSDRLCRKQVFWVVLNRDPYTKLARTEVDLPAGEIVRVQMDFTVPPELAGSIFRLPAGTFYPGQLKNGDSVKFSHLRLLAKKKIELTPAGAPSEQVYDFSKSEAEKIILHDSARIENGELVLDGRGYAELPQSSEIFKLTPAGLTMSAVVAFDQPITAEKFTQSLFSKGISYKDGEQEWSFWRMDSGVMAAIFRDENKRWYGGVKAGNPVPAGEFAHYALVIAPLTRSGQGEKGYLFKIYINGSLVGQAEALHGVPFAKTPGHPVFFGFGPEGKMRGRAKSISIIRRAFGEQEIEDMVRAAAPVVKLAGLPDRTVRPELLSALDSLSGDEGAWLAKALKRAAGWGADQNALLAAVKAHAAGKHQDVFKIIGKGRLQALILLKGGRSAYPVAGLYDRELKREILGRKTYEWRVVGRKNGKEVVFSHETLPCTVIVSGDDRVKLTWRYSDRLQFVSNISVYDNRVESDFAAENGDSEILLTNIMNPSVSIDGLNPACDKLVLPFMAGIELESPTVRQAVLDSQNYIYPTSNQNMQFCAYYDDRGGVYSAWEDPTGSVKRMSFQGRRGNIDTDYNAQIGYKPGATGGNSYKMPGKGVIAVFSGNWYEAGQIYRKFLKKEAFWWMELPRENTPSWFQKMPVGLRAWVDPAWYKMENLVRDSIHLARYFEMPVLVANRNWYDFVKGGYPHFYPWDDAVEAHRILKKHGMRVSLYIDDRLWETTDGKGGKGRGNWLYDPVGIRCAVVNESGEKVFENYPRFYAFLSPETGKVIRLDAKMAIMCPAAAEWQQWLLNLCDRVATYGADSIYHDQVSAATPKQCYSPAHGHDCNSADVWVGQGFRPLLENLLRELPAKYPELTHTSEDAAEPYVSLLDGFMVWRWTHQQIPLFQSIYGGRAQFLGRTYNDTGSGGGGSFSKRRDAKAFYAKMAEQLVHGEILGWINTDPSGDSRNIPAMLFTKRMGHLRMALADYFRSCEMQKPPEFRTPVP